MRGSFQVPCRALALSDAATVALIAYPTDSRGVDDVPDGATVPLWVVAVSFLRWRYLL